MRRITFLFVIIFSTLQLLGETGIVKGIVTDQESNKTLSGANIILAGTGYASTSGRSGKFNISGIPDGKYEIIISYIGYQTVTKEISVMDNEVTEVGISLSSSPISLGEVIVTSTKKGKLEREESLPIEIISKNELEILPSQTISDVLRNEPGLSLARDGIWLTHINIRGLSRQNIVTLIDGSRIETATNIAAGMSLIDVDDIDRIEVIKGAASSLYGTGATGGVVNIQTSIPAYSDQFQFTGSVLSSYNSVNEGAKGNLSLSASQKNWYAKVNGTLRNAGNANTPDGILENSQYRDNNVSASLGIMPTENHELKLNYQRFSATDVGIPGGNPIPANAKASYPSELRELYNVEYKIHNLFPSLMTLNLKYFHQLVERRVEIIPNPNASVNTSADHNTNGFQIQSDWYLSDNNRMIFGVDGWQREYQGSRTRYVKPKDQYVIDSPVPNSIYKSLGFFAQDEFSLFNKKLNITLGARYDFINVSNEQTNNPNYIIVGGNRNDNPPIIPNASYAASEDNDKSWSANFGLLYNATKEIDLTLNLAHAFRSPTLEERYQYIDLGGTVYLGNPFLEPEKNNSVDLGFRYWSDLFSLKTNFFFNSFTDLVADQFDNVDSLYRKQNIGEANLYGFEVSAELNPIDKVVIYATASYVRGEDTGNRVSLAEIPPINGIIGMRSPVAELLNVDVNMSYAGDQNNTAVGEKATAGYAVFNLFVNSLPINLGFTELQLFAGIENIFDRAYRNHLSTNRGIIALEPGRNIFAKIRLSW